MNWAIKTKGYSQRGACGLVGIDPRVYRYRSTTFAGTWLFLIGSILFGLRPSIKMFREITFIRLGDYEDVAKKMS